MSRAPERANPDRTDPRRRAPRAGRLVLVALVLGLASCSSGGDATKMKPPACSLSAASLDFGSVALGASTDLTFSITNVGEGTLAGTVSSPCGDYSIQGTASYDLGAGASATFTVRFTPSQASTRTCALDAGSGCTAVSCTGIGLGPCQVSPTSLDFGTVLVGQNVELSFTITNNGSGTLVGAVVSPCGDYTIQGTASYTLGPTESATITVRFTPSQAGTRTCTLDVGSGCASVSCTGIGASPCQVSPTSLDFGTIGLGGSADRSFTITNLGGGTLSGTVISPCSDYTFVGSPSYDLGAGGSATITLRFTPSGLGASNCTLDTGSPDCQDVTCSGSGKKELGSSNLGPGATFPHTFANPGTYQYHCAIHGLSMHGTVVVAAGGAANASVSIRNNFYTPSTVTVSPGGTVTWTDVEGTHTVTSD